VLCRASYLGAFCVCAAVIPNVARAGQYAWELALEADADWLPHLPGSISVDPSVTGRNALPGNVPLGVGVYTAGLSAEAGLVFDDTFLMPLVGMKNTVAVGPSAGVISSLDGSIVEVKPWSLGTVSFMLPGVGYRFRYRWVALQARLEPWLAVGWMQASVYSGPAFVSNDTPSFFLFSLQARLEACWRSEPTRRYCGFVAPNLWALRPFNGGTVGFRWEVDAL
jgi:hypothetical protein